MFRISQYMQEIQTPTALGPKRNPPGPVVIWNLIRRCNLACKHCYSISADTDFPGELSTAEVYKVMDDLNLRSGAVLSGGGRCCDPTSSTFRAVPRTWASTSACPPTARSSTPA
jgi:hypothetical protein